MLGISVLVSCPYLNKLHAPVQFVISQHICRHVHQIVYKLCSDIICAITAMLACLSMLFSIIFSYLSMLMPLSQLGFFILFINLISTIVFFFQLSCMAVSVLYLFLQIIDFSYSICDVPFIMFLKFSMHWYGLMNAHASLTHSSKRLYSRGVNIS